ncbi:MAG: NAD(P)H-binding protein [Xanthomonadales bacterium]|nr:NAD(P)H-binding protein [Xanthomonadales bacterium]MCP5475674.1 NAD(P)H-binding protein [Rhodanobacteraceae bacterium]
MRILVLGALGFIGRHVVSALQAHGHEVVAVVRPGRAAEMAPGMTCIEADLRQDNDPALWLPRLAGIDAVVNAAGILKASDADFDRIHCQTPLAVARAAAELGLRHFLQISALGDPRDAEFVASKHRADQALLDCGLPVTVLRPSLVYAFSGSYGGSSLLRALAAAPGIVPLPGRGLQPIQPLHVRDLAEIVVAAVSAEVGDQSVQIWPAVGPEIMTLGDFLRAMRQWLRLPKAWMLPLPMALLRLAGALGDRIGDGPLGSAMVRMLARGNSTSIADAEALGARFGHAPQRFAVWAARQPAEVQDRWQARLYPLAPVLRWSLGLMCLLSAMAGFATPPAQISVLAAPLHWPEWLGWLGGYGGSLLDAVLGALLIGNWHARAAGRALLLLVLGYTVVLGWMLPGLWLDPWGALAKNLVVIPATMVWLVLADRR